MPDADKHDVYAFSVRMDGAPLKLKDRHHAFEGGQQTFSVRMDGAPLKQKPSLTGADLSRTFSVRMDGAPLKL